MHGIAFLVLGAAMLIGSARGAELFEPDHFGHCLIGSGEQEHFGTDNTAGTPLTTADECLGFCRTEIATASTSPLRAIHWNDSDDPDGIKLMCLCYIDSGSLIDRSYLYVEDGPPNAVGLPNGGDFVSGGCWFAPVAPVVPCAINVVVGIDQTSMKRGDTSTEAFKDKLFELTDELPLGGANGVRMQVAFLQGHKQNGNKHKKQITTAMSVADSMPEGVDPRDFVTETGVIRRPRTPFLSFFGVEVPLFGEAVGHDRPAYCLIFTNKGDIARGRDKKELRKFARGFKRDPPCTPVCYQNSPEAGGPSFMARVLCSDELSFYSDTYDAEALKETMCDPPQ